MQHNFSEAFELIKKKEAGKCQKSFGDFQRDAPVKTDAESLEYIVSFVKALREERCCETEGRREKDELGGLESTNGQVCMCMI